MSAVTPAAPPAPGTTEGAPRERPRRLWIWWLAATAAIAGFGIWLVAPRFDLHLPSLLDDWFAISNAPNALRHLVHLDYVPDKVGDPRRYRPAFTAVWSALQWHTLGAPRDLTGVNFWNIVRLALFAGSLVWLTIAAVPRARRGIWLAPLAFAVPFVVLATPVFAVDFTRLGPVEQNLVGATLAGGLLLAWGTGAWLRHRPWWQVAAALVGGYLLWLFGVYQKEASACYLLALPFAYLHLNRRWREDGTLERPLWRERSFQIVALLAILPLLHMVYELERIAGGGQTVYGAPIPSGTSGWITRLRDAFDLQWDNMGGMLLSPLAKALAIGSGIAVAAAGLSRRRVPWLALGLVVCAWAMFVFQGLGGQLATRYYLPSIALFAAAVAVALTVAPMALRMLAIAGVALFALANVSDAHKAVQAYVATEQVAGQSVKLVADLNPGRCPVYMGFLEEELADSLPVLVGRTEGTSAPCDPRFRAMLVRRPSGVKPVTNEAIHFICAKPGWQTVQQTSLFWIQGCKRFTAKPLHGKQTLGAVLAEDRLVPGVQFAERRKQLGLPPPQPAP